MYPFSTLFVITYVSVSDQIITQENRDDITLMNLSWRTEPLENISDAELIKRAQTQQIDNTIGTEAVGELYNRYHESVFRYIWARVSDQQLTEDLTGDVFTRMVVNLSKYRLTGAPFLAWLYSIARNLVIDHYRKAGTRNHLPLEQVENIIEDEQNLSQVVENQMFIEQVQRALKELNPTRQDVLILRFIMGLSLKEVASILRKTIGSIKVTQHRALNELRIVLESNSGEER